MRQAHIFYKDQLAGILTENDAGYEFCYLPEYLSLEEAKAVSMKDGCWMLHCGIQTSVFLTGWRCC